MIKNKIFPPLFAFLIYFSAIEFLTTNEIIDPQLFPSLSQVLRTLGNEWKDFSVALTETFSHSFISLFFSFILGFIIALFFSSFRFLRNMIFPFAIFFQTVPIIAIAPLLVIYLGYGAPTIIASSIFVSIFPIIANTLIGLESTPKEWIDLFKIYKISPLKTLFLLKIPAAYTFIYSGLKISAGLAVIGVVAGEFVAGSGLGSLIDSARTQQRIDIVFGALLLLAAIGLVFISLISLLNMGVQKLRPLAINLKEK